MTGSADRESWVVLLQRFDDDALYEAAAMAASATSLGIAVTIVWFDAALEALVSDRLDERGKRPASAGELFLSARETGLLRSLACSASAVNRRDRIEKIREDVDEIVGWPTVISLIRSATRTFAW
jgi:predicted peroxiredoxin